MQLPSSSKPFPIPVVATGPGAHTEDETLDYLVMPQGMSTYRAPRLPEPEALQGHADAVATLDRVLHTARELLDGGPVGPIVLDGLAPADLALINQVLGEGEVSAQVLATPGEGDAPDAGEATLRAQESVFAGIWRVMWRQPDGHWRDQIEVGAVPAALKAAAREDARRSPALLPVPPGIMNAQAVLTELADHRHNWRPGQPAQVVNLSLLPLSPDDIGFMDQQLGTGRVLVLSRGYGNCRISNACVPNTWRVVYYNSQDTVILNSVEVTDMPEVACAAREDLEDSAERLAEVLAWVRQG